MQPIYYVIIDTSALLSQFGVSLYGYLCSQITQIIKTSSYTHEIVFYLPWTVMQELDSIKESSSNKYNEKVKFQARHLVKYIFNLMKHQKRKEFSLNISTYKIKVKGQQHLNKNLKTFHAIKPDDDILQFCINLKKVKSSNVLLLSNDNILGIKAFSQHIPTFNINDIIDVNPLQTVDGPIIVKFLEKIVNLWNNLNESSILEYSRLEDDKNISVNQPKLEQLSHTTTDSKHCSTSDLRDSKERRDKILLEVVGGATPPTTNLVDQNNVISNITTVNKESQGIYNAILPLQESQNNSHQKTGAAAKTANKKLPLGHRVTSAFSNLQGKKKAAKRRSQVKSHLALLPKAIDELNDEKENIHVTLTSSTPVFNNNRPESYLSNRKISYQSKCTPSNAQNLNHIIWGRPKAYPNYVRPNLPPLARCNTLYNYNNFNFNNNHLALPTNRPAELSCLLTNPFKDINTNHGHLNDNLLEWIKRVFSYIHQVICHLLKIFLLNTYKLTYGDAWYNRIQGPTSWDRPDDLIESFERNSNLCFRYLTRDDKISMGQLFNVMRYYTYNFNHPSAGQKNAVDMITFYREKFVSNLNGQIKMAFTCLLNLVDRLQAQKFPQPNADTLEVQNLYMTFRGQLEAFKCNYVNQFAKYTNKI